MSKSRAMFLAFRLCPRRHHTVLGVVARLRIPKHATAEDPREQNDFYLCRRRLITVHPGILRFVQMLPGELAVVYGGLFCNMGTFRMES